GRQRLVGRGDRRAVLLEIGRIVHRLAARGDLGLQPFDQRRQLFELARFLVAELAPGRRRRRWGRGRWCGPGSDGGGGGGARRRPLPQPVGVTADVFAEPAVAFQHQGAGDHVVEEVAVVADQQQRALV